MRNRFNGSRRGRRPDSFGSVPGHSSPYDFTSRDEDSVDPVDLLSIRADDELLDALASGLSSFAESEGRHALGVDPGLDGNINDDQQMVALLAAWRDEIRDAPVPELISVDDASRAIVAGYRTERPRRRLMSVAAAAAAVVVGMSGVALGAGSAKPGDTLWGVSKALNSDRASSLEAAQQVSVTLASVRQALAEGHVAEAQAKLASITPVLSKVTDEQTKDELAKTQANLAQTVGDAKEGEKVKTDDSGRRDDDHDSDHRGGSNGHDSKPNGSQSDPRSDQPNPDEIRSQILRSMDPRFSAGKPGSTPGSGDGRSGSAGQPDPRRTVAPTTDPKQTTKPSSGPRPSKWNPPPRRTPPTTNGGTNNGDNSGGGGSNGANNGANNGGNNGANNGGHDNAGNNGNSSQDQGKPDGQHKGEGEGDPATNGGQGQPGGNEPAQPGPRPVPPGS